ncbi:hypothetical protein BP6252_02539 [Coleophoma cylindrospora]|uniref:Nucleoporin NUP37 n=1 Tax=Coleophoma cylindrospora TaxID=1849047 RepID=A0A3D8SF41_9HELO|nr:hypothetical protein BP6252_02539 [Coleophoma cylindrospora]
MFLAQRSKLSVEISYELPNRIHTAKTYPILSPNGSTIVIYGQENGVKIVWRGGRSFKEPQASSSAPKGKPNGTHDAVVLLDSDDEDAAASLPFEDNPEFEDEEVEIDPLNPYPGVLQVLDLYFGTDVLHLALLPHSHLRAEGASWKTLGPLRSKIVFAAACADNTIRLVTLPLTPPSPLSKARETFQSDFTEPHAGKGKWGETVALLNGHQKPSHGISMTTEISGAKAGSKQEANIVVASHSQEVTGLLLVFSIPLKSLNDSFRPLQTIYLSSPAKSISFNPSLSEARSSHLLVADSTGACRIYDYRLLIRSPSEDAPEDISAEQGSWLLSLYPAFQKDPPVGAHAGFGRKIVIDAKWIGGGGAIIALFQDGEWAIWDIEGVGPGSSSGLLGRQSIKGGSRSAYSISGWIENSSKSALAPTVVAPKTSSSRFVPMTPGTRKTVDLFSSSRSGQAGSGCGEICVLELPPTSSTATPEESVVFWLGETFAVIPSISKYWKANAGKKSGGASSIFNSTIGSRLIKLEGISLQGERCMGIDQSARPSTSGGLPTEITIIGEHRFTILFSGKISSQPLISSRSALVERKDNESGELDVVGIDQALALMDGGSSGGGLFKKKKIQR